MVSRARKQVAGERRAPATGAAQRESLTTFVTAARSGGLAALEQLFAVDVTSYSDGNAPCVSPISRWWGCRVWRSVRPTDVTIRRIVSSDLA
jgi:hypothetical protein